MEPQVFDVVKFEKEKAIARFNRFRKIVRLWQIFEVVVVLGLISWSSARVPAVLKVAARCFFEFSTYLFNHHVVFLIGNAIIGLLFVLCRQTDAWNNISGDGAGEFYDDYVKHSEMSTQQRGFTLAPPYTPCGGVEEKQIVVCREEAGTETEAIRQCDDVAIAIEKASRQIKKFQRTQSEKLRRQIAVRQQPKLMRSETQNSRKTENSGNQSDVAEIERLSSDEFQRTVDAFIDKHWSKKKKKQYQFEEYEKYQLLKME